MKYVSTRGKAKEKDFLQILIEGLASDGGLYVPKEIPVFSEQELAEIYKLKYHELAYKIVKPFIGNSIDDDVLKNIINDTYSDKTFYHKAIVPLTQIDKNLWMLELFHGPTISFKDYALQAVGRLFDYALKLNNQKIVIIGATSGDTGSAAIYGCKSCNNADIFILHPHNAVSEVQRKQMTTIDAKNVYNIALKGNFDDCQNIVKYLFNNSHLIKDNRKLVAVNSINWARILFQIVYYFYACSSLGIKDKEFAISVPTGNFGDIFAGYIAKKMGLPIKKLIIANNNNDILTRFINSGIYKREELIKTITPSMDIQVASNFERLLFDIYDQNGAKISDLMEELAKNGQFQIEDRYLAEIKKTFVSYSIDDERCVEIIKKLHKENSLVIDPHTAVGFGALYDYYKYNPDNLASNDFENIVLSTAHPAKFEEAIIKSGLEKVKLPNHMQDLFDKKENYDVLDNDSQNVANFINSKIL